MNLRTAFVSLLALALLAWFLATREPRRRVGAGAAGAHGPAHSRLRLRDGRPIGPGRSAGSTCWRRSATRGSARCFARPSSGSPRWRSCRRASATSCVRICSRGRKGLATTATFATIVMERVLDLIAVLALLAVYVWGFTGDSRAARIGCCSPIEVSATLAAAVSAVLHGRDVGAGDASRADRHARGSGGARPSGPPVGPQSGSWPARSAAASRRRGAARAAPGRCSGRFRCGWRLPPRPGP